MRLLHLFAKEFANYFYTVIKRSQKNEFNLNSFAFVFLKIINLLRHILNYLAL